MPDQSDRKTTSNDILRISAGVAVFFSLIKACSSPSAVSNQMEQVASLEPPIAVTAQEIAKAYDDNEVAARERFKDRSILVSGVVDSITLNISDEPVVNLSVPHTILGVSLEFASGQEQTIATLAKGKTISVTCTEITEVLGAAGLDNCAF